MSAQIRKWFYLFSALASALVPILVSVHAVGSDKGTSWLALVAAIGGLFGAGGAGTAAVVVHSQQKNGTDLPAADPVQAIINNVPVVVANANNAISDLNKVKNVAADLAGIIPGVGPLAEAVINSIKLP